MMNKNILLILIFTAAFYSSLCAQWELGSSFNYKTEEPVYGFEFKLIRNLPFQFADFGIKTSLNLEQYYHSIEQPGAKEKEALSDIMLTAALNVTFYYRYIQPYAGFGLGGSYFNSSLRESYFNFLLTGFAGIRFEITEKVNPFLELKSFRRIGNLPQPAFEKSSSIFFNAAAGVIIDF